MATGRQKLAPLEKFVSFLEPLQVVIKNGPIVVLPLKVKPLS
jgi:hypothetical protein